MGLWIFPTVMWTFFMVVVNYPLTKWTHHHNLLKDDVLLSFTNVCVCVCGCAGAGERERGGRGSIPCISGIREAKNNEIYIYKELYLQEDHSAFEEYLLWHDLTRRALWCWHQKVLIGQPLLTVGGSFCQELCADRPRTVRVREQRRTAHTHNTHTHTHIEFHQESEKVNRKRTAQQSRKMKRWKSLLSEIRGDGCKEKWKYKGVQAWRDRTGWKVNNTGRTFEALILRSEKVTTLVQSDFYFLWSVSNNNTIIPLILH